MPGKVIISALNQYRFIPLNEAISANYNNKPYKSTLFGDTRKYWQIKPQYAQKVQTADVLRVQVWTGYDTAPITPDIGIMYLRLFTCKGVEIGDPLEITRTGIPAFPDENDELIYVNGIVSKTYWAERMELAGVDEGEFHFILEVPFTDTDIDDPGIDYFRSEPIHVKAKHPKTILMEVSHSVNKDNTIFRYPPSGVYWKWAFRVEGYVLPPTPQVDRVVFKDQGSNSKQLSATVYNKPVISIGYTKPVPYWCIEKANHYLACNSIYIDTVGYTVVEGSQLTLEQPDNNFPFYQGNMDAGEKDNNQNFEFSGQGIILIRGVGAKPYFISEITLGPDNVTVGFFRAYNVRIGGDEDQNAWLAEVNDDITLNNTEGTIAVVDDNIVYLPAVADQITYGKAIALFGRFGIVTNLSPMEVVDVAVGLRSYVNGNYAALCKPDGSTAGLYVLSTTSEQTITTSYASGAYGEYVFEVFHDQENIKTIKIDSLKVSDVTDFGTDSNVPYKIATFELINSERLFSFDAYSRLANCRNYLYSLHIHDNPELTAITLYIATSPVNPGWAALTSIDFSENKLSQASIDAIYISTRNAHLDHQWLVYNGSITTWHQSPPAVPSVASANARTVLGPTNTGGIYNWFILATP